MKKYNLSSINFKKMLMLSTVILFTFSLNAQDWEEVFAFEPAQSLRSIKFVNELVGYTSGSLYNGSTYNIHKTTDGGNTWIDQSSGYADGMYFNDTYVFSEDTVMMCGKEGIVIHTTDGGENWISNTVVSDGPQLGGISFVGETGYVAGDYGRIFKTDNMGESWTEIASPTNYTIHDIYFITKDFGFINGINYIGYTKDGGQTWLEPLDFPSPYTDWWLREFSFVNENVGFVCGDGGLVFKTDDGGISWQWFDNLPDQWNSIQSIVALDENTVYTCGYGGTIMHTIDGGENWEIMSASSQNNFMSMDFTPGGTGFLCSWLGEVLRYVNVNPFPPVLNFSATVNEDDVTLIWDAPATGTPNSFNIYRDNALLGNTTASSYDDLGLAPGTYEYYVTAVYDEGESDPSNTVTAVVEELVLDPPTNLSATANEGDVALTWDTPATGTPNSFNVYRDNDLLDNTTNLSYDDIVLASGNYEYYVTAVYDDGESDPSNYITVNVTITGIEEQEVNITKLYPNPATDQVNISSDYTMQSVTVYNFAGQVILAETIDNTTYRVNASNFEAGIYLFQIATEEGRNAKRIIIE